MASEKKKAPECDADLPKMQSDSLGSFKDGIQSLALRVRASVPVPLLILFFTLTFFTYVLELLKWTLRASKYVVRRWPCLPFASLVCHS